MPSPAAHNPGYKYFDIAKRHYLEHTRRYHVLYSFSADLGSVGGVRKQTSMIYQAKRFLLFLHLCVMVYRVLLFSHVHLLFFSTDFHHRFHALLKKLRRPLRATHFRSAIPGGVHKTSKCPSQPGPACWQGPALPRLGLGRGVGRGWGEG